jgi:aspartyl aminopeptidase
MILAPRGAFPLKLAHNRLKILRSAHKTAHCLGRPSTTPRSTLPSAARLICSAAAQQEMAAESGPPVTADAKNKASDMLSFINTAWTPYHAVEEASRRLLAAGFTHIAEKDAWNLKPGVSP